jgi:hypothetical protein
MRHLRALLAALAVLFVLAAGASPAAADHQWDHPQMPAACVATTGGVCPP